MYPEGQNHPQFKITDHTYAYLQNGIISQIQPCLFFFNKLSCHELISCQLLKTYCIICNICRTVHRLDSCEVIYVIKPPLLDFLCKTEIIWHTMYDKLLFKFKMSWTSIHIIPVGCWPNYSTSLNLHLLICRMGMFWENDIPEWVPVPSTENVLKRGPELSFKSLLWSPCPGFLMAFSSHSP